MVGSSISSLAIASPIASATSEEQDVKLMAEVNTITTIMGIKIFFIIFLF